MSQLTRRRWLQNTLAAAPVVAFSPTVPAFCHGIAQTQSAAAAGRVLVLVELAGGNDGINTVVPFADPGYARARRRLRLPARDLVRLTDQVGLHPALAPLAPSWEAGRLAIVQGVGYPNPTRSHFESQAIWQTARRDFIRERGVGWFGRVQDQSPGHTGQGVFVGTGPVPLALRGLRHSCVSVERLEECRLAPELPARGPAALLPAGPNAGDDLLAFTRRTALDAYGSTELPRRSRRKSGETSYPPTPLAGRLRTVAAMIRGELRASVYYVIQDGGGDGASNYDTHYGQLPRHAGLLGELAAAWRAFLADLEGAGLGDRVVLLAYSEFGRRVAENASGGTDHGTAGPVLLAGRPVRGGLVGATPSLLDLEEGDLRTTLDFRRVYASVLEDWLALPSREVLAGRYERLPLFRV
jgi:uncharacterized protein (DUF1501 family)